MSVVEVPVVNWEDLAPLPHDRERPEVTGNSEEEEAVLKAQLLSQVTANVESELHRLTQQVMASYPQLSHTQLLEAMMAAVYNVMADKVQAEQLQNSQNELQNQLSQSKKKPIRVYLDGCFDLMHSGHYNAVRQAKSLGDILVVGIHTDDEILRHKGPPLMNNEERLATVKSCKWVDEVCFGTPYTPTLELLDKLNCDYCVHGDDTSVAADGTDAYAEVKRVGRMRIVKRTQGVSTTDLVGRLLLMTKNHHIQSPGLSSGTSALRSPSMFGTMSSEVPELSLGSPAEHASPSPSTPQREHHAHEESKSQKGSHYTEGISNFLPTTWRISQFANNRTPRPDDRIVYIDGSFDLFHVGHIETLKKARELGTFLYVGIHDDNTVNKHRGRNYPIMNLHERVLNVLSSRYVDEVIIGAPWVVTDDMLNSLNIAVVASGSNTKLDRELEVGPDPYAAAKLRGIYVQVETTVPLTTPDVVERIIGNRIKYERRNASREKKELDYIKNRQYVAEI